MACVLLNEYVVRRLWHLSPTVDERWKLQEPVELMHLLLGPRHLHPSPARSMTCYSLHITASPIFTTPSRPTSASSPGTRGILCGLGHSEAHTTSVCFCSSSDFVSAQRPRSMIPSLLKSLTSAPYVTFPHPRTPQELGADGFQAHSFMLNFQEYFEHFTPTLRFLPVREPRGSSRQILYFIWLFPNLQNLKFYYDFPRGERE